MSVDALKTLPAGVTEASELIRQFDECLLQGFARLGDAQRECLDQWVATFANSPLEGPLGDAVAAVARNEFLVKHFLVLAGARAALQGAQYDALVAQAREAFSLDGAQSAESAFAPVPGHAASILGSAQQWLMEMALAGLKHLEEDSVAPFSATLAHLQDDPELSHLAAMLTGFFNELLAHMPAERHAQLPVFRWADLWCAAMVRTQQSLAPPTFEQVDGSVVPLGLDVASHENFVCAVLYGLLAHNGSTRTVRVPLTSYKVNVVQGPEIWDLFGPIGEAVLGALEGRKKLQIQKAELLSNGDLILKSKPKLGPVADPFAAAAQITALPKTPALLRHPVHIAEVVHLQGDSGLPIAAERLPADGELTDKVLASATEMIALARFDRGGWRIQPLCARGEKGDVLAGEGIAQTRAKRKSDTLAVLKERSSKLLRES